MYCVWRGVVKGGVRVRNYDDWCLSHRNRHYHNDDCVSDVCGPQGSTLGRFFDSWLLWWRLITRVDPTTNINQSKQQKKWSWRKKLISLSQSVLQVHQRYNFSLSVDTTCQELVLLVSGKLHGPHQKIRTFWCYIHARVALNERPLKFSGHEASFETKNLCYISEKKSSDRRRYSTLH